LHKMSLMRFALFCVVAGSILLCQCRSDRSLDPELPALEEAYEESPGAETGIQLINKYLSIIPNHPDDRKLQLEFLGKGLEISREQQLFAQTGQFLTALIKADYNAKETPQRILDLAELMDQTLRKRQAAQALKMSFVEAFPNHPQTPELQSQIEGEYANATAYIDYLGTQIFDDSLNRFDQISATYYVDACEAFAMVLPGDEASIDHLYRAAEVARSLRTFGKAVEIYDWIYNDYTNNEKAPQALFLKAFTYDNDLGDYDAARVYYEEFLEMYPDHHFSDDTEFLLQNLGKSDEEILESLNAKSNQ
jgi:tetratricopeptide (TPR) repeat protein